MPTPDCWICEYGDEGAVVISDAEILLGLSRHLGIYEISPAHAALEDLQLAGQIYEISWRLKGSGRAKKARVDALIQSAGILRRRAWSDILPVMGQLDWVEIGTSDNGTPEFISEFIPPSQELVDSSGRILDLLMVDGVQRCSLVVIRATSRRPLTIDELRSEASDDPNLDEALRHLESLQLVKRVEHEVDRPVFFNPNVWVDEKEAVGAALRVSDSRAGREISALMEEISEAPGLPAASVTSTEPRWVSLAVAVGLIQRSVIQTADGREQAFLFSPLISRGPFGNSFQDPSGNTKQLVGSMMFATTFAQYKLYDPVKFLDSMIDRGEAGNVSNIRTDYPMLETAGIVTVAPGTGAGRYKLVLQQPDVATDARDLLAAHMQGSAVDLGSADSLGSQRRYDHVESQRARLAKRTAPDEQSFSAIVAALRDTTGGGGFGV